MTPAPSAGPRGRVLVVDDEKLIRWSVSERLARTGHEVHTADSGERALEVIAQTALDVVILDVRLGGIDGVETLTRGLALRPDLVVVMMSAHGTVDLAVEAMKRGATDFLVKPFPLTALDSAVEHGLRISRTRQRIVAAGPAGAASDGLVGDSPALAAVREMISRIAASSATTVLIEGESGVGKDVVARAIHERSARAPKPFVQLNCAALPEQLLESELFGHERGAFTDAKVQKQGLFEVADGGSAMLDEIGDLSPGGQAKLLRLLESKSFRRVGGVQELKADVRVIAATNTALERRVEEGRFRADLFFRLNVVRIEIPPLRERREDIPGLTAFFVARYNEETKRQVRGIAPSALELLCSYRWPGNVRELRNTIERAFILHPTATELTRDCLAPALQAKAATPASGTRALDTTIGLDELEKRALVDAMEKARGNQSQAARLLGITRDTLRYRLKKHGLL